MDLNYNLIEPENIHEIKGQDVVKINGTQRTPKITFDTKKGELTFKGHSLPENTGDFYYPILQWVRNYIEHAPQVTNVNFDLEYFNSSSFKMLL